LFEAVIREVRAAKVLELGCGTGYNMRVLAPRNANIRFVGIDFSPEQIDSAQRFGKCLTNASFHVKDMVEVSTDPKLLFGFNVVFETEACCHLSVSVDVVVLHCL